MVRLTGETMGTGWSAQVVVPRGLNDRQPSPPFVSSEVETRASGEPLDTNAGLGGALRDTLAQMIAAMSQWEPTSALSRFNRCPIGEWQDIPDTLATVLSAALAMRAKSDGAFDPATGALADLWGFGPPGARKGLPSAADVTAALASGDADAIEIDGLRARRTRDIRLDLSGIGKGHAVDALAATCQELGSNDFLVEIGGEFVGSGIQPNGQPWWVDLEPPPGLSPRPLRIAMHGVAVATSGNYRRFVAADGRTLGHTIDPRTGWPVDNGVVSVSVIASDCMTADGWATALTVLGCEAGMALADREELAVRMVMADGTDAVSEALRAMF